MEGGTAGAIAGSLIGVIGGLIGTAAGLRSVTGPRERAFVIRAAACLWLGVVTFLAGLWLLPRPWNFLLWVPYGMAISGGVAWVNRKQASARILDAQQASRRTSNGQRAEHV